MGRLLHADRRQEEAQSHERGRGMNEKIAILQAAAMAVAALVPLESPLAADMPLKAPAPAAAFIDWSGIYVGAHAGYGGGMKDWFQADLDFPARGFLAGGQAGINKQIASFVFGLELDGSWANITGSRTSSFGNPGPPFGVFSTNSGTSGIDGLVTVAGRAGLTADRWFVFARGGAAGAWERHFNNTTSTFFGPASTATDAAEFRWGSLVGFGAEYALDGHWSVTAEYDHMDFGTKTVTLKGTQTNFGAVSPLSFDQPITENSIHVVKVGANYRWGGISVDPVYPPVRPAPGTNWTGAYLGAQGSYGFGRKEWPDFADPTNPDAGQYNVKGWLGGIDGGFNVQSGVLVFGVEGEWMWSGISGGQIFNPASFGVVETDSLHSTVDWLAIASARAGFVIGDRLLIYGKGGVAIADEKHSYSFTRFFSQGAETDSGTLVGTAVHSGAAVGAGAEYVVGGNWSIKGEYDYIRMMDQNVTVAGAATDSTARLSLPLNDVSSIRAHQDLQLFKLGVNYHFGLTPVVITARD
jgi:outer membrane immunogenic protein